MFDVLTSKIVNQVLVPGSRIWKREKRALVRRWKRAMLLPETALLAALIIGGGYISEHTSYRAGQTAMAAGALAANGGVIEEGVPGVGKRRQRVLQDRLRANPGDVMVLTSSDVVNAFSYPDLKRAEGAMTVMQFRGEECVLDLYLKDGKSTAIHYEFHPRRVAAMTGKQKARDVKPSECVGDILKSRRV